LTALAGVGPKTIEKIEAAGINNVEKLASMTPEQLMEIPGIGEKMVDKIYQAVNRFYEGGGEAEATAVPAEGAEAASGAENADALVDEASATAEDRSAARAAPDAQQAAPAEEETKKLGETAASESEETHDKSGEANS